ncbi:hypothetical protein FIN92_01635 [Prevotella brunnea]|uniref:hypothetical protein n=1 Tax=Prevotella brunnea TaxID=2508867 RepID=UPI00281BA43D|nr:hypothetical protein [Prevotella brunnea]MDR0185302.1 hypothetical protein [Prevotella brunnea]
MTKYKSDIADSASNMMQLPGTLEGMLQDIHGQKEVSSPQEESKETETLTKPTPVLATPKKSKKQKLASLTQATVPTPTMVDGDGLWTAFCSQCAEEDSLPKVVGKDGNMTLCKVNKDILATFRKYAVGGYSTQTIINAILHSFILHYKKEFSQYRVTGKSLL